MLIESAGSDQPVSPDVRHPMTTESFKSLIRKYYRLAFLVCGGLLLAVGWGIDIGGPGRGPTQHLIGATGAFLILVIAFGSGRLILRVLLILGASYCTLIGCELVVRIARRPPRALWQQYHRLYRSDPVVGYTLTPLWQGQFNDGYAQGKITVNSLGQRDDEPSTGSKHRILLLGDSFTFGALLDQSDTIDKQIERLSTDIDAYNLGVPGYGLPAIIETLKRCDLPATEAFYLFYNNDLQNDDLLPDNGKFVVDGHLVPTKKPDGTLYTEAEIREKIAGAIEEQESKRTIVDLQLFLLPHIRQLMNGKRFYDSQNFHIRRSSLGGDRRYSEENVKRAISHTQELGRLSSARGMPFYVLIIPTLEEVRTREYSLPTAQYLKGIENQNMTVVPLIQSLAEKDYFSHDGHFTPSGALVAAEAIYRKLKPRGNEKIGWTGKEPTGG